MPELTEIYFDDSGNTGDDLDNDVQRNMFIAGVVLIPDKAESIPRSLDQLIDRADRLSGVENTELKGSHIYTGKGAFANVALRYRVELLEMFTDVLLSNNVKVLWQGFAKWMAKDKNLSDVWNSTMFGYCTLLHDHVEKQGAAHRSTFVCGDANSWVGPEKMLIPPAERPWPCFQNGAVCCLDSAATPGLQMADLAVHTLYRANKAQCSDPQRPRPVLSRTDEIAVRLHSTLAARNLWVCLDPSSRNIEDGPPQHG